MPRTTSVKKTTVIEKNNNGTKTSEMNKKSSEGNKKETVNVKVPSAREKSKDFDEDRRSDANSNEL